MFNSLSQFSTSKILYIHNIIIHNIKKSNYKLEHTVQYTYLSPPANLSGPMSGSFVDRFLLLPKAPIPRLFFKVFLKKTIGKNNLRIKIIITKTRVEKRKQSDRVLVVCHSHHVHTYLKLDKLLDISISLVMEFLFDKVEKLFRRYIAWIQSHHLQ